MIFVIEKRFSCKQNAISPSHWQNHQESMFLKDKKICFKMAYQTLHFG